MARDLFQEAGIFADLVPKSTPTSGTEGRDLFAEAGIVAANGAVIPWEQDWSGKPASGSQKPWEQDWSKADAGAFADLVPKAKPVQERSWARAVGDTAIDVAKGAVGLGEAVIGVADLATGNLAGKGWGELGFDPTRAKEFLSEGYSDQRQQANRNVSDAKGFLNTAGALVDNPSVVAGAIAESAPMMLGSVAAVRMAAGKMLAARGLAAGSAEAAAFLQNPAVVARLTAIGSASEGAMTAGNIQEQGRQAGRDYTDTAPSALAGGAITGAIGFGTSKIPGFRDAEVGAAIAGLGGKRQGLITAGKEIAKGTFKEGVLEEMPQSTQEQIFTNLALGKPWDEGVAEAAAQGLVVGAGQGGGMNLYSAGRNAASRPSAPNPSATPQSAAPADQQADQTPAPNTAMRPEARLVELDLLSQDRGLSPSERAEMDSLVNTMDQPGSSAEAPAPQQPPAFEDVPDGPHSVHTQPDAVGTPARQQSPWDGLNSGDRVQTGSGLTGTLKFANGLAYVIPDTVADGTPSQNGEGLFSVTPGEVSRSSTAAPAPTKAPSHFWNYVQRRGFAPGEVKKGSPAWTTLQADYQLAKAAPAPAGRDLYAEAGIVAAPVPTQSAPAPAPEQIQPAPNLQNRDRSRASSVMQMAAIARNPDYGRLGTSRTPDSGAPLVFAVGDQLSVPDTNLGNQDVAVLADGERVPFRYAVVEASKIEASNFADGRTNPAFSANVNGTLKALNNGRSAGLRAAYEMGTATNYQQELIADVASHGVPADVINRTTNPVLVRIYSEASNTPDMAAKSQGQGLSMSPTELALQDAPLLDASVLAMHEQGDVTSAGNRDFVRAFVGKLKQSGQDTAAMMTADGTLSPAGRQRIQAALMQNAYGDADLVAELFDSLDTDVKAIGEALKTVAGEWANMRDSARWGIINPEADITSSLVQAVNLIRKARRERTSLYELTRQPDLMTGETPDPVAVGALTMFYPGMYRTRAAGRDSVVAALREYVRTAMGTSADADMFGQTVTPINILDSITNQGPSNDQSQQANQSGRGTNGSSNPVGSAAPSGPEAGQYRSAGERGYSGENRPGERQDPAGTDGQTSQAADQGDEAQGPVKFSRANGKSSVLSKDGTFQAWPKSRNWTRAEYNDVVSLLPERHRSDPHRREPLPTKDWDALPPAVALEIKALEQIDGHGSYGFDSLGNILIGGTRYSQETLKRAIALADKHDLGIFIDNVRLADIGRLMDKGFVGEIGIGSVLQSVTGSKQDPLVPETQGIYRFTPGDVMSRKPRGFAFAMFSRSASTQGLPASTVQQIVDQVVGNWINAPDVVVLASMADAPAAVRKEYERQNSKGATGSTEGFFYAGTVYVVADQLATATDVMRVLFHEALGHMGLRGAFGDAIKPILANILQARRSEVAAKAQQYGLDMDNREDALTAAEEVLAEMAQTKPEIGFVTRAVAAIRTWLRTNVPGFKDLDLTDAEIIRSYIIPARDFVQRGQGASAGAPAFSRNSLGNTPPTPPAPVQNNAWTVLKNRVMSLTSPENIDKLIYEFQDKHIDLKRIIAHIKELGGTVTDLNDAYLGEELFHKRLAKRTEDFLADELKPMLAQMKATDVTVEELETYLHARHAPEANAAMAKRNPNAAELDAIKTKANTDVKALELQLQHAKAKGTATKAIEKSLDEAKAEARKWFGAQAYKGSEQDRLSLSGMSDSEAAAHMANLSPGKRQHLDALAAKVDAINAKTLDTLAQYGLMDRASLDAWRSAYQFYVPLHRDEARAEGSSHPIGMGFSVKGDAAKQRTGSNRKVTHILGHIAMQREAALTRGEKNHVAKKLYLLAAQNPDDSVWTVDTPPVIKTIDPNTGIVRTGIDPTYKNRPNVLMVRIAGKDVAIVFNEENKQAVRLVESMKLLDVGDLHVVLGLASKGTRWFASINTQYNPIFGLVNFARDFQEGMVNLSTTPLAGQQREVAQGVPDAMRAVYRQARGKGAVNAASAQWIKLWEEMQNVGGATGYRDVYANAEDRVKALTKELDALNRGEVSQAAHAVVDWLSDYNEAMENAVRLSAYKAALDSGMTKVRAASLAKNLTVNFNRKGRQTREIGALYAFFNAAIQGTTRMAETLKGPMGKRIMYGGVALGAISSMVGVAIMGGGDGEDDEWEKIPEFIKENSLIIPIGRKDYLSIPMPLGFKVLPNIGRLSIEFAMGGKDKSAGKQLVKLLSVLADAFNPLGGSQNLGQMVAPTVIDPVVALMQNRDWTGRPIYRENFSSLDPEPGHLMAKNSASSAGKALAKAINSISGGTDYRPGMWSPTPDQLDYVFGQLTGGLGRELLKANQVITSPFTGDELPAYKIPLVGRIYGNTEGPAAQSEQFYANVKELNEVHNEMKGRNQHGGDVDAYRKSEPLTSLAGQGDNYQRNVSQLRKQRANLVESAEPGYQARVKEIDARIGEVMERLNNEVRKARKEGVK